MTLWSASDAAAATGGQSIGDWAATGVSIDTRTLVFGDLFIALKDVRDGHEFVAQALQNGAAAAMVSRVPDGVAPDAPLLVVKDVLPALEALGRAARARSSARVVAVTGSVGKTSTKDMLRVVLAGQGATHAAEASYNNHWGVPLTLARMPQSTDFAVIEIGMNHPGEIAPLSKLARPDVALITTIAAAHLEAFENIEGIAHEKASIFDGLEPNGTAIVNCDVGTADILLGKARAAAARVLRFGQTPGVEYHLCSATLHGTVTVAQADAQGAPVLFKIRTPGMHFAVNALAVLAAVDAVGADRDVAVSDLGRWLPTMGRGTHETLMLDVADERLTIDLIDDAFNANPASVAAALDVLAGARPEDGKGRKTVGRRIAVLGDMLELGRDEITLHSQLAQLPALEMLDIIHTVGPRMRALHDALPDRKRGKWVETPEELAPMAARLIDAGDVILVKGSKGSRVSLVVDALRRAALGGTREEEDV